MKSVVRLICIAGSAGVIALAGAASAQQPPRQPDLHVMLHLRPDQERAWQAFQAAARPSQGMIDQLRGNAQRMAGAHTPQRLELASQNLSIQEEMFHRYSEATRQFYASLSPAQQQTFDQVTAPSANRQGPPR